MPKRGTATQRMSRMTRRKVAKDTNCMTTLPADGPQKLLHLGLMFLAVELANQEDKYHSTEKEEIYNEQKVYSNQLLYCASKS